MKHSGKRNVWTVLLLCTAIAAGAIAWQTVQQEREQIPTAGASASSLMPQDSVSEPQPPTQSGQEEETKEKTASSSEALQSSGEDETVEEGETYVVYTHGDYLYTSIPDLYEQSELVIYATYLQDHESFADEGALIDTIGEANVLQILKGSYEGETIRLLFNGGTVPASEYLSRMLEESKQKYGFNEPEFLETYKTFTVESPNFPNFESGKSYLLFLDYADEYDSYAVNAGCYGAREVSEDGGIYSPDEQAFVYQ